MYLRNDFSDIPRAFFWYAFGLVSPKGFVFLFLIDGAHHEGFLPKKVVLCSQHRCTFQLFKVKEACNVPIYSPSENIFIV